MILISGSIENKFWIETQLIDCLFEIDLVDEIYLIDNKSYGNKIIRDYFEPRKFKVEFTNDLTEMDFILVLLDGFLEDDNSYIFDIINDSFYSCTNMNIRYTDEETI